MSEAEIREQRDNPTALIDTRTTLSIQKMKKDKEFSDFLEKHDKDMQESTNNPIWKRYREMLVEYSQLNHMLATCNYYIAKHV